MKLFEHEAKDIFRAFGMPTPPGGVAKTPEEAKKRAEEVGKPVVVKAQVLSGKRGKAGGVKFADTPDEAASIAKQILAMRINDLPVEAVLVEEKLDIQQEIYAGITIDRNERKYVVIGSAAGGMSIEELAEESPEKIIKMHIDPFLGFQAWEARNMAIAMGFEGKAINRLGSFFLKLWKIVEAHDVELTEINPLILTKDGRFLAADARLNIDDNSLFRHKDIIERIKREPSEQNERERMATENDMAYVELDGDIACICNGAGLTMATLDAVSIYGGKASTFLDLGGGADAERVEKGIEIAMMYPRVKAILINIMGGITRCDEVAKGIVAARDDRDITVPLVIRMVGTNEEEGQEILNKAGIPFLKTMEEAASKVVELVKEAA
ncbi:MAG: ADP-forming succinate--CoA ligase subunit beta [Candidatus Thorarchaeota archaeon]|nr:MAG: ADP-forming succinate--CoA ligase subunit beta [Candidatus Thorarchaeota archaeon]RLI59630.1 MAG: ADP-forming succinate--CoA ligase subunit beta [Candidatus Thorarchaeota archaeon]